MDVLKLWQFIRNSVTMSEKDGYEAAQKTWIKEKRQTMQVSLRIIKHAHKISIKLRVPSHRITHAHGQ